MSEFKKGQKVWWRDPEDETSGVYEVYEKTGNDVYLIGNGHSEAEVYEWELYNLPQRVVFRKWIISGAVIALFPELELEEHPLIVASYDTEDEGREVEYDFVMEATAPAGIIEYQELLSELQSEGYGQLEVVSEPVRLYKLLREMAFIAQKLITSIHITDFTTHDKQVIIECEAERPFIWQIRNSGTWLYFMDEPDWKKQLEDRVDDYKYLKKENLYYLFDGEEFYPVFEQTVLDMLKE